MGSRNMLHPVSPRQKKGNRLLPLGVRDPTIPLGSNSLLYPVSAGCFSGLGAGWLITEVMSVETWLCTSYLDYNGRMPLLSSIKRQK